MKTISEVREKLFEVLERNGLPIFLQGAMSKEAEYPDTFLTYFIPTNDDDIFADNAATHTAYTVQAAVYSNDIDKKDAVTEKIKADMKAEGFLFQTGGDVASDVETHTGYMQQFIILT